MAISNISKQTLNQRVQQIESEIDNIDRELDQVGERLGKSQIKFDSLTDRRGNLAQAKAKILADVNQA